MNGHEEGSSGQRRESALDPRDVELLTNSVAEKALEKIRKTVQWPLLLAGALAAYTGYNIWTDVTSRIDDFQKEADKKLEEIDRKANERLDEKLERILDDRKADISDLTNQLRKESAGAVVEAERARLASLDSSERIKRQADETVVQVNRRATETISALEERLREVNERRDFVLQAFALAEQHVSEPNRRLIRRGSVSSLAELLSQPALNLIGVKAAIEEVGEGQSVTVAVLSTGFSALDSTDPTIGEDIFKDRVIEGRSMIPYESVEDKHGHGTWLTSLVATIAPSATILPVKVLSNAGKGPDSSILAGLNYAASAGARIVVLPIHSVGPPSLAYSAQFKKLHSKGVFVLVAAGDDGGVVGRPANSSPNFAVSATDLKDDLLGFSNRGRDIDLAAPGGDILTVGTGGYRSFRGTSFATAIVGGVAALILSARPELSPDDVETILKQSAKKLDLLPNEVGAGRVDALAAVRLAKSYN